MFKSSENLRLAAEMRALRRVAAPWREARTTWFDGTPESIEARLAATERVLSHARAGTTTAHLALEREASAARSELLDARHRLMVDFLDDGARAFKGSKRVAAVDPSDPESDEYTSDTGWQTFDLPGDSFNDKHDWLMKQLGRSPEEAHEARDGHYPPPSNFDKFVQSGELPSADSMREDIARWTGKEGGYRVADKPVRCPECGKTLRDSIDRLNHAHGPNGEVYDGGPQYGFESRDDFYNRTFGAGLHTAGEYDEGIENLSRYLGDRLLNPEQFHRTYRNEEGQASIPGGWPTELRQHLNDPYSAGYAASGHMPYLTHEEPWEAAGNDFYNAGGRGEGSFDDGWLDYASDIPHKYNDPEATPPTTPR